LPLVGQIEQNPLLPWFSQLAALTIFRQSGDLGISGKRDKWERASRSVKLAIWANTGFRPKDPFLGICPETVKLVS
jgi:hypothetical protein